MRAPIRQLTRRFLKLKASGADVFMNISTPKFAAQAIKKNAELAWKPLHILHSVSQSISSVMKPAGVENGKDIVSANYGKDPADPNMERRCWHEEVFCLHGEIHA